MVKIKQTDNKNTITVSSKSKGDTVIAKNDSSLYYSNLSKEWACKMPASVDGIEYSAKYYAEKSKQQAILSKSELQAICEQNIDDMQDIKDSAVTTLENAGDEIIDSATQIYNNTSNLVSGIPNLLSQAADINLSNISKTGIGKIKNVISADLITKVNTDLTNITDSAKVMISGMGMPSNTYVDVTVGASGAQYLAPADGWIRTTGEATVDFQYIKLVGNIGGAVYSTQSTGGNTQYPACVIPVRKGSTYQLDYSTRNMTMRFIYAVGSESEV